MLDFDSSLDTLYNTKAKPKFGYLVEMQAPFLSSRTNYTEDDRIERVLGKSPTEILLNEQYFMVYYGIADRELSIELPSKPILWYLLLELTICATMILHLSKEPPSLLSHLWGCKR